MDIENLTKNIKTKQDKQTAKLVRFQIIVVIQNQ